MKPETRPEPPSSPKRGKTLGSKIRHPRGITRRFARNSRKKNLSSTKPSRRCQSWHPSKGIPTKKKRLRVRFSISIRHCCEASARSESLVERSTIGREDQIYPGNYLFGCFISFQTVALCVCVESLRTLDWNGQKLALSFHIEAVVVMVLVEVMVMVAVEVVVVVVVVAAVVVVVVEVVVEEEVVVVVVVAAAVVVVGMVVMALMIEEVVVVATMEEAVVLAEVGLMVAEEVVLMA